MPHVLQHNYSNYYDLREDLQFLPVLDQRTGLYVAHAEVSEEQAARYDGRPHFEVLTAEAFQSVMSSMPAPEPSAPTTGDPLTDAALAPPAKKGKSADATAAETLPPPPPVPESN